MVPRGPVSCFNGEIAISNNAFATLISNALFCSRFNLVLPIYMGVKRKG